MKRKFLLVFLSIVFVLTSSLSACKKPHVCTFDQKVASEVYLHKSADCLNKATYYYSCICGKNNENFFEYGDALNHNFAIYSSNNDATCLSNGTESAKCTRCDEIDVREELDSILSHSFTEEIVDEKYLVSNATCIKRAVYNKSCVCGKKGDKTFETGGLSGHKYGSLIKGEPATEEKSGIKDHYKCGVCKKYFDANKNQILDITIPKKVIIKGVTGATQNSLITGYQTTLTEDYIATIKETNYIIEKGSVVGFNSTNSKLCKSVNFGSADLGIPIYDANKDEMLMVWGDTFSTHGHGSTSAWTGFVTNNGNQSRHWNNMTLAKSNDVTYESLENGFNISAFLTGTNFSGEALKNGVWADGVNTFGQIASPIHRVTSGDKETSKLSTGGLVVNGTIYLFYSSNGGAVSTTFHYSGCVKSTDGGKNWERVQDLTWCAYDTNELAIVENNGEEDVVIKDGIKNLTEYQKYVGFNTDTEINAHTAWHFTQMTPVQDTVDDGRYQYFYGQGGYRQDSVYMARVLKENLEDFSSYEYFSGRDEDGNTIWVKNAKEAKPLIELDEKANGGYGASNISCAYNEKLRKWMFTGSIDPVGEESFSVRIMFADTIDGVYSNSMKLLVDGVEGFNNYAPPKGYPFTGYVKGALQPYGAYLSSKWISDDGLSFYCVLSQYNDCYNVSLLKVTLDAE
ncbi:MAG: DUF4185 domain-containing protein [Clostridiales bacterium]|nr:DUF4185 domain-containing protein [Clostridiales bacterium]